MDQDRYKGVPLSDLRIEAVVWTQERIDHIRIRTVRYGATETNLEPEWVDEAVMDGDRIVAVSGDKEETSSLKVVGYSISTDSVLKAWIWSDSPATSGTWNGGSASLASDGDRRRYGAGKEDKDVNRS
jgi:hypothetical protein